MIIILHSHLRGLNYLSAINMRLLVLANSICLQLLAINCIAFIWMIFRWFTMKTFRQFFSRNVHNSSKRTWQYSILRAREANARAEGDDVLSLMIDLCIEYPRFRFVHVVPHQHFHRFIFIDLDKRRPAKWIFYFVGFFFTLPLSMRAMPFPFASSSLCNFLSW